ncbi:MAG: ankyrin repeat domain-containing protein, partial [Myxococcales bacterium]|nr:ankyrin repeat domain-containing protein [Myxococcales bacterium]
MPWSFSGLYTEATPLAMTCLKGHAVLGPALHHLRSIGAGAPALPRGGLLALPDFGPPDAHRLRPEVPWDALLPDRAEGRRVPRISFADPREVAALRERGLGPAEAPPRPTLAALKQLSLAIRAPLILYRCEMWGGDLDLEVAWIPGWVPGEVDRLLVYDPRERRTYRAVGAVLRPSPGDVLVQALEYLRLRLPSPYFAPHTSRFDWGACRLAPAPACRHPSPPVHPRSLLARVYAGDLDGARALLDAGADPNAYGWTRPLEVAAEIGRVDLVELLLDRGAEIAPEGSLSALHSATDVACARLLLDRGAPLEGADARVITPLASAAQRGDDGVVRLLLERG